MLALQLPTSPIDYKPPAHAHHFCRPLVLPASNSPASPMPTPRPAASRKPKLSLVITPDTKRTFTRCTSLSLQPRGPMSAMSPTTRNTLANAKLGFGCGNVDDDEDAPEYASSTSSDTSSETSEDMPLTPVDEQPLFVRGDKKRKRAYTRGDGVVASPIEVPRPQPKKRGLSPSERRVRFVEEPVVIEYLAEEEEEVEGGSMVMEQMVELRKLRVEVSGVEENDEEKEQVKEGSGWMWKLGQKEYEQISKVEELEARTPVVETSAESI